MLKERRRFVSEVKTITTVEEAIQHLQLMGVVFYSLSADQTEEAAASAGQPNGGEVHAETRYRASQEGIDYRCRMHVETEGYRITVDAAISYRANIPVEIDSQTISNFGTTVAMMALYPYLRQQVSDLAMRLGVQLMLPVVKVGDIAVEA